MCNTPAHSRMRQNVTADTVVQQVGRHHIARPAYDHTTWSGWNTHTQRGRGNRTGTPNKMDSTVWFCFRGTQLGRVFKLATASPQYSRRTTTTAQYKVLRLLGLIQQIATTEKSHVYLLQHHRLRIAHYKTTANHQTGALFEKGLNNKVQVLFPFTLLFNDCALLFLLAQTTPVHCGVIPGKAMFWVQIRGRMIRKPVSRVYPGKLTARHKTHPCAISDKTIVLPLLCFVCACCLPEAVVARRVLSRTKLALSLYLSRNA